MIARAFRHAALGSIALGLCVGCLQDPSLDDPYEANGYKWPYESPEAAEQPFLCPQDTTAPLGTIGGEPVSPLSECAVQPEGDFPLCASFADDGRLEIRWEGVNGFALFVTEPDAVIPVAPNTPVSEGETFWAIGPEVFPSDGFASPMSYGLLVEGTIDVTADHAGTTGGTALEAGRCYKVTVINNAFRRASLVFGWQ